MFPFLSKIKIIICECFWEQTFIKVYLELNICISHYVLRRRTATIDPFLINFHLTDLPETHALNFTVKTIWLMSVIYLSVHVPAIFSPVELFTLKSSLCMFPILITIAELVIEITWITITKSNTIWAPQRKISMKLNTL